MKTSIFDHTREFIAIIWTCAIIYFIWYCIVHYGQEKEILTWVLAYIAGVSSGVQGAYFSINTHKAPVPDGETTSTTTTETISKTTPVETTEELHNK